MKATIYKYLYLLFKLKPFVIYSYLYITICKFKFWLVCYLLDFEIQCVWNVCLHVCFIARSSTFNTHLSVYYWGFIARFSTYNTDSHTELWMLKLMNVLASSCNVRNHNVSIKIIIALQLWFHYLCSCTYMNIFALYFQYMKCVK